MVIFGVFSGTFFSTIMNRTQVAYNSPVNSGSFGAMMAVVYIIIAVIYFFLVFFYTVFLQK